MHGGGGEDGGAGGGDGADGGDGGGDEVGKDFPMVENVDDSHFPH